MSKIHEIIEYTLRRDITAAANGDGRKDPRGQKKWIDVIVGMGMLEIGQWLDEPADVTDHLDEISKLGGRNANP